MAKVRIQTRTADEDEAKVEHIELPVAHQPHHDHSKLKHPGAIDILAQVLQREGILGWYRVSFFSCSFFGSNSYRPIDREWPPR
jgi:hypothetical protein